MKTIGYAAQSADAPLAPFAFERRELRPNDVAMEILYCGVCHTDLHQARNDWGRSMYPLVPGHEIVGRVIGVGREVTRHKVGDAVAVGCMVDSCQHCDQCRKGEEQLCREGNTQTYNDKDRITGVRTYGGYSRHLVVREEFVLRVPDGLDLARAAPLLCAGITTYSPLRTWNVGPGSRVGVIGLGGLGHMAVKLASALGAEVTVLSRSSGKEADALALGADRLLVSTDADAMAKAQLGLRSRSSTRFPSSTTSIPTCRCSTWTERWSSSARSVRSRSRRPCRCSSDAVAWRARRSAASPRRRKCSTSARDENVLPDCEMIRMDEINKAFERMERSDVRYRFVIDMSSLPEGAS